MNTLFMTALIVEAIFGFGFVLVPGPMLAPYAVTLDNVATTFARMLGAALLSFAILLWLARKSQSPDFRNGVITSLSAYFLISSVVLVIAQSAGLMNAMGWIVVTIHVVFVMWFGYFLLRRAKAA
ncbi:MAG TPA: hypothetical protein VLY63_30180 [Anaerolineae bacterium]|nr:hypothetical protein [Anaerolineae bacterium]